MTSIFATQILLLIPAGLVLLFGSWALWGFSKELWANRRRVRRVLRAGRVVTYWPRTTTGTRS